MSLTKLLFVPKKEPWGYRVGNSYRRLSLLWLTSSKPLLCVSVFFLTFKLNCSESRCGGLVLVPWNGGANPPTPAEGEHPNPLLPGSWVVLPGMAPPSLQVLLWDSRIDRPVKGLSVHLLCPPTRGSDGASSGHPVDPSTLPLKRTHYSIPSHRKVHTPSHRKTSCFLGTFLTHLRLTIISLLVCASGVLNDKRSLEKWKQACLFKCARGGVGLVHALIW